MPEPCRTNAEVDEAICGVVRQVCLEAYGAAVRAVVLTGSLARGEASIRRTPDRAHVLGDAEFFLVLRDGETLPGVARSKAMGRSATARLAAAGVECEIDLATVHGAYFASRQPAIFAYELRVCGKVIWGENVLRLIPAFSSEQIPREDGLRILCNRGIELLGALAREEEGGGAAGYAAAKLYLDMATSLLLFLGAYAPGYKARRTALAKLVGDGGGRDWPFEAEEFSGRVARCTEWKLSGMCPAGEWNFCAEAAAHAAALWRWELARMGAPVTGRLRGWMYVLRAMGWHRSWRYWPRWARMARTGSPRAWIYAVARELLERLAAQPERPGVTAEEAERMAAGLPLPGRRGGEGLAGTERGCVRKLSGLPGRDSKLTC